MTSLDSFKSRKKLNVGGKTYHYFSLKAAEKNGLPGISRLLPGSKAFDRYYPDEREAISDKTLNTLSPSYIKNPRRIFTVLKGYVDAADKYKPRAQSDLEPVVIDKKTIHLAVPDFTAASQWHHVMRAILYAKERKVTLIVTRVR